MSKKSQIIPKVKCLCFCKVIYLILIFSCKKDGAEPLCKYLYSYFLSSCNLICLFCLKGDVILAQIQYKLTYSESI